MSFPILLNTTIQSHNGNFNREITIRNGLTVLIGPNGSGKTHLLRAIKNALPQHVQGKKVRFISAGRMGTLEHSRSDYDGYRGDQISYENANFGRKSDVDRRHKIETLNGDFQTLSERADILVKVQERLKKLFKRDLIIEWDAGTLKVVFARLDNEGAPYSSGREASGLLHLVGLLSALYDDDVGALILDEPEVSLHPQLQAFLLNEIASAAGHYSEGGFKKIIVMATHSTEMLNILKCDDLLSLVFCHDLDTAPVQISPESGELQNKKIQALIARLGQEHKLSLFCKKPLLVEGPSDALICSFLSQKLGVHLEASGSQLLPVIGTGQMPVVSKFIRLMGKTPVVLADADAFADSLELTNYYLNGCIIADQKAAESGAASAASLASAAFNDFCQLANNKWEEIKDIATPHPYWVNRGEGEETKAKRRSVFCALFSHDESTLSDLNADRSWVTIRNRLEAVLGLLELAGCFILRRGAIESYYQSSDTFTSEGKPSAAVDEIEHLDSLDPSMLEVVLPEVTKCIKFASQGEKINETESLRDVLLSIAAPAIAKLNTGSNTQEMKILCKTILREKSELFDLTVEGEQLSIALKSNILNVRGFPITIEKGEDVVSKIERILKPKA
ncbi:AAA family ATPase [Vibrio parahaemolyticus]|uniref:ATP-dependent nuclease n=3 Tax=Vibrio parahaemolyticus TaxID=670 RepID=UPI00084BA15D|nr:AAA family ATPase [Vibrio parahaemolyticus]EGQ7974262.1 AAA family ATPase [Vibrio parahaemolyticus]EIV8664867.1 AAA family ATPase [Vibrio parahaemolyticus]ELA9594781.1 AAA family ATPase [Vibrio parahaemolyticus]MBE4436536.1 AAA family ATPase [Vibrio parahaemolyticus]MCR9809597.1 AAA family ATPase [Vibrio parahaemolyticus]